MYELALKFILGWLKPIFGFLKPFWPYFLGAGIAIAVSVVGFGVWQYKRANSLQTSLSEVSGKYEAAAKGLKTANDNSKKAAEDFKTTILAISRDIQNREKTLQEVSRELNEANAAIQWMLENGDDDTKRFLGPLPGGVRDFLRDQSLEVPSGAGRSGASARGATGKPSDSRRTAGKPANERG